MFGKKKDKATDDAAPAAELKKAKVKEPKVKAAKEPKVKAAKEPKVKAAKEPKVKAPKAAKKKTPNAALVGKSGPNFLAAHVEKIALGVIALAVGYLIYSGLSQRGLSQLQQP